MENLNDLGEYLNTEIVCTLAGLGYSEGSEYFKSPDCLGRLAMLGPLIITSLSLLFSQSDSTAMGFDMLCWAKLQNTGPLICMLLNPNSAYCVQRGSSQGFDTCKTSGPAFCSCSYLPPTMCTLIGQFSGQYFVVRFAKI